MIDALIGQGIQYEIRSHTHEILPQLRRAVSEAATLKSVRSAQNRGGIEIRQYGTHSQQRVFEPLLSRGCDRFAREQHAQTRLDKRRRALRWICRDEIAKLIEPEAHTDREPQYF